MSCEKCGKKDVMPYKCKFCGNRFCSEHRLPENHNCLGLAGYKKEREGKGENIIYHREDKVANPLDMKEKIKKKIDLGPLEGKLALYLLGFTVFIFFIQLAYGEAFTKAFYFDPSQAFAKPWMFITSVFLHGGFGHLLFNMLVLFFFGILLEKEIGSFRFLIFYILAGIVGNLGYLAFTIITGNMIPALGASGALYGVFAALAVISPGIVVYAFFFVPMKIRWAFATFALIDILLIGADTGVARAAHLAGGLIGLVYGIYLKKTRPEHEQKGFELDIGSSF